VLSPFQDTNNKNIAKDFTDLFLLKIGEKGKGKITA
jgi:hypothetical protein